MSLNTDLNQVFKALVKFYFIFCILANSLFFVLFP